MIFTIFVNGSYYEPLLEVKTIFTDGSQSEPLAKIRT